MNKEQIDHLIEQGNYEGAENACDELLRLSPNDLSVARTAAWAFVAIMKHYAGQADAEKMIRYLERIQELQLPENEEILYQNVVWTLRTYFDAVAAGNLSLDKDTVQRIFRPLYAMPVNMQHTGYSVLLNTALRIQDPMTLLYIIKQWNLCHLQPADFQKREIKGMKVISLAEKAYYAQCKAVIAVGNNALTAQFLPVLQSYRDQYPKFEFLPYYQAKMLILTGNTKEALEVLKPFARKKNNEFWIWQLIGDCHTMTDDKMMFYCKAVSCRASDEMMVKTRIGVGLFMLHNGKEKLGKFLLEKSRQTYLRNGWHLSRELTSLFDSTAYRQIIPEYDADFVASRSMDADGFLFGQLITINVLITFYNEEYQTVGFLTEQLEEYKGRMPKNVTGKVTAGSYAAVTVAPLQTGVKANIRQITVLGHRENPHFYRTFFGSLRKLPNGNGVVNGVFLHLSLLSDRQDGEMVSGMAVRSLDKKKNKWGWKALTLDK